MTSLTNRQRAVTFAKKRGGCSYGRGYIGRQRAVALNVRGGKKFVGNASQLCRRHSCVVMRHSCFTDEHFLQLILKCILNQWVIMTKRKK